MTTEKIICKVCDRGELVHKFKYRMSTPVVAIGYILLIPSVLGIAFSLFLLFSLNYAGQETPEPATATEAMNIQINLKGNLFDAQGMDACRNSFVRSYSVYYLVPDDVVDAYCRCAASQFQSTSSLDGASSTSPPRWGKRKRGTK